MVTHLSHQEEEEVNQILHALLQHFGKEGVLHDASRSVGVELNHNASRLNQSCPGFYTCPGAQNRCCQLAQGWQSTGKAEDQRFQTQRSKRSSNARETQRVPLGSGLITGEWSLLTAKPYLIIYIYIYMLFMYKCGFTMCPIVIHNVPYSCKAVACPGQVWSIQDQRLDVDEPTDVVR